jgi:hypothetical protein
MWIMENDALVSYGVASRSFEREHELLSFWSMNYYPSGA